MWGRHTSEPHMKGLTQRGETTKAQKVDLCVSLLFVSIYIAHAHESNGYAKIHSYYMYHLE